MKADIAKWRTEQLAYCSNVHPASTYAELIRTIEFQISGVRDLLGLDRMASGLWISHEVLEEISTIDSSRSRLSAALKNAGINLLTLNGFPYGNFHDVEVKEKVYQPDWSDPERLKYTLKLAEILAEYLAPGAPVGTISTLPLGFALTWSPAKHQSAIEHLVDLVEQLAQLEQRSGRHIMVCLEMEPGCVLQCTDQLLQFFDQDLVIELQRRKVALPLMRRHLGVCYDICHQAVMFEDAGVSLQQITDAGISIGKIQVSSALRAESPGAYETRAALSEFVEPRYLHQVETKITGNGEVTTASCLDLADALADPEFPATSAWHIHFHIPIQASQLAYSSLGTTQNAIVEVLDWLQDCAVEVHPHFEVETYTWQVLPAAMRPQDDEQLQQGLSEEIRWLQMQLQKRGLLT